MVSKWDAKRWLAEIKDGEEYRKKYGRSDQWDRWEKYYCNEYGDNVLSVNMIFAIGKSLIPRLYFRNPRVRLRHLQPGFYLQARVLERVDHALMREMYLKQTIREVLLDIYLKGTGIIKEGYDSEFGFVEENATPEDGALTQSEQEKRPRIEYDSRIRSGWPWVKRVSPWDFVVPWGTNCIDDAYWCAHSILRDVEDIKADPKYDSSKTKDLKGTYSRLSERDKAHVSETQPRRYAKLWEIYDAKHGEILVIAEGNEGFLRKDKSPFNRFPFRVLVFNDQPDHLWGLSDCVNIEPQQLELNDIRTVEKYHRRISLLRFLASRDAFKDEELDKFLRGDLESIGNVIKVDGRVQDAVIPLQPYVSPDFNLAARAVREDIRELTGFSRNSMGEFDMSSRRTATEVSAVERAAGIRIDERRDILADAIVELMRDINDMIFKWWTDEKVASIVGPTGARYWVKFTGTDLNGHYLYQVDPDEALPLTSQVRKAEAQELLSIYGQNPNLNLQPIIRYHLDQFEGLDADEVLMTPSAMGAPPVQDMMSIQELALQLAKEQAGMA